MSDTMMSGPPDSSTIGAAALGAARAAKDVAMQAAAYDQELAKHASYAAAEMDEMHRSLERYIFGTTIQTLDDVEPHAGQVDHTPPEYSAYSYPAGKSWPTNYPAPATPLQPTKEKLWE